MTIDLKTKIKNPHFENVTDVSPQEVFENAANLTLVDVREPSEYAAELGHIESAKFIILRTLPENLISIPTDKPVVFVCRSGGRSAQASSFAQAKGLKNTYNMQGGMILWNQLQLPTKK